MPIVCVQEEQVLEAEANEHLPVLCCSEMIHLMQLPNPDTLDPEQRPQHGGRDRHFCIGAWLLTCAPHHASMPSCCSCQSSLAADPDRGMTFGVAGAGVQSIDPLIARLDQASVPYTKSMSGRPAVFFRDPDMNVLEIGEMGVWHA